MVRPGFTVIGITVTGVAGKATGRSPRLAGFFLCDERRCRFREAAIGRSIRHDV